MGKTLIILAFVVVLIVIVVIAGLHYLRADDDADELAADPRDDDRLSEKPRGRRGARSGDDELAGPGSRREIRDLGGSGSREAARSRPADQDLAAPSGAGRGSRGAAATVVRDRAAHDDADARPAARRDSRRSRASAEVLPPVRPRSSRGKRDDGDWPTSDWDSLSDVDFWHEVAADKPFSSEDAEVAKDSSKPAPRVRRPDQPVPGREERTRARIPEQPAGPGPARTGRAGRADRHQTRRADQGPGDQARDHRPAKLADAAALDTVAMPQPAAAAPAPEALPVASAGRVAGRMPQPGHGSRPGRTAAAQPPPAAEPTLAMLANMGSGETARPRNDDDPLTSPSFPSIQAADSRSYRRERSGQYGQPARTADIGATEQFSRYPSAPAGGSSATAPGSGYRDAADGYRAAQPAPAATARPEPRPDPYPSLPPAAYADDAPYAGREYSEVSMADRYGTAEYRAVRQQDNRSPREALAAAVASGDAGYGRRSGSPLPASGQHSYFPGSQPDAGNLLPPVSGGHHRQADYGDSYQATGTPQPTRRSHGAHAAGNRVGDLTQTGGGYSSERGRRQRDADRYNTGSYPEPASLGSQSQVAGYGQTSVGYDAHRGGPGPATWYLGMDPATQAPAVPRRDDQEPRSAALPRTAARSSYRAGESAAPVSYPTSYVPGYQPDRYLAAPALPDAPAGGYAGGDPYAADRASYRGDDAPLR